MRWVVAAAQTSALDLVFEPDKLAQYAAMDSASRGRVRDALCERAGDTMNARLGRPDDGHEAAPDHAGIECHASMTVDAPLLDRVARQTQ